LELCVMRIIKRGVAFGIVLCCFFYPDSGIVYRVFTSCSVWN
jgi:hypothetical protein